MFVRMNTDMRWQQRERESSVDLVVAKAPLISITKQLVASVQLHEIGDVQ